MSLIIVQKKAGGGAGAYALPAGSEILWFGNQAEIPADFSLVTAAANQFIMGAAQNGATDTPAGANSHTHSYSANTGTAGAHTHTANSSSMGSASGAINMYPTEPGDIAPDGHTHNASYGFTSSSAGSHEHGMQNTGSASLLPPYRRLYWIKADVATTCPINGIVMWNGTQGGRPDGFNVCNGANSTPDMRDNFVYVASADGEVNNNGGATSHTHTNSSVLAAGQHTHSITISNGVSGTEYNKASGYGGTGAIATPHNHGATGNFDNDLDHTHTLGDTNSSDHLPEYYYLYYIMRTE
jgi:hypothetical protein